MFDFKPYGSPDTFGGKGRDGTKTDTNTERGNCAGPADTQATLS